MKMLEQPDKPTILVVDDTPENLSVVKGTLSSLYVVKGAVNGPMALKIVEKQPPDLILLDIMMPGMDGYEVCRHLKESQISKDIPVIFLTAKVQVEDEKKGLALGAVDYITKPFNPAIMIARINTQLVLKQQRDELEQMAQQLSEVNETLLEERQIIEDIVLNIQKSPLLDLTGLRVLDSPLEATSGDIICAAKSSNGHHRVLLGDFTGHGLTAAIGGPLVSEVFYSDTWVSDG
jgi:two-component system, HptB-dependent secretion and biofilm response regulator